ncbi:MAG TPA: alpha-galactosidase [Puia sp.]|jgi:alpha-galactosidase|nr:alpha-galactosidase [Puia sp.]
MKTTPVKRSSLLLLLLLISLIAYSQADSVTLENNTVARMFHFSKDSAGFYTKTFINKASNQNYVNPATEEFNIRINDSVVTGLNCRYLRHSLKDSGDIRSLVITLQTPLPAVFIELRYELYADIPLVRKQLKIINNSPADLTLTDLDVENLRFQVVDKYQNEVHFNYGGNITRIPYKGDYNDAAIMLYNDAAAQGAIFGNEAPGVLKNTGIYTNIHGCIEVGMRHIDETFPFKTRVRPGELFISPKTFVYVFNSPNWQAGFEGAYKDFVRKYLGISLFAKSRSPLLLYDTWRPFQDTLDEKLIKDCADKLAAAGAGLFIIDAGWYKYSGDFIPDSAKFPNGIKAVCDYIRSKGLQAGIWFTVAGVNAKSKIAEQHPEWLIRDKKGGAANLHNIANSKDGTGWGAALTTMSLGSPYFDHIKNVISTYIRELGVTYVKLDLSMVVSAYVHQPELSGDYGSNPSKLYRDHASSYWTIYQRCQQLMDDLHSAFPGILIDCTFETWGRYNVADYGLLEHADYDWLSNIEFDPPLGPITIRQMNYDRSRVIPTAAMLIGNQYIDINDLNFKYAYFSLASASLVMVGDPRKLTPEQQAFYYKWNSYLKQMEAKYQYSRYYELYDIFDRPTNNNWDGCYRINTEKQGGLMFFYRNNSSDAKRTFKIPCLHPTDRYKVYSFETGKKLGTFSGATLIEKGITVTIPTTYTARVLTIEKR